MNAPSDAGGSQLPDAGSSPAPGAGGPPVTTQASRAVPESYGDVAGEYGALRDVHPMGTTGGAIVVDRSSRFRCTLSGPKAADVLTGLVTNDILALEPGSGCYAVALTAKGKIVADLRILAREGDLLVDVAPGAAAGWWAMIRKYVNPRLARYADTSAATTEVGVFGTRAHAVVAAALGIRWEELHQMAPFAHRTVDDGGVAVLVARVPDLGVQGFSLIAPADQHDLLWRRLQEAGARPAGRAAVEIARIESGRPEFGVEMDDSTLAQEANMDALHAISYTKGCYTGQETVARVHFRGHVNRYLRGLRYGDEAAVSRGAEVLDDGGKVVGDVRSAVRSPRLGGIAIAMLRREVADDREVVLRWDGGEARARVVPLPFPLD